MKPQSVNLDDADSLISAAALLAGDDVGSVLTLLMTSVATLLLDANDNPARAVAAALGAGPPLAGMVEVLAEQRLAQRREGGNA